MDHGLAVRYRSCSGGASASMRSLPLSFRMRRSGTSTRRMWRGSSCCRRTDPGRSAVKHYGTMAVVALCLPPALNAQARVVADPMPPHSQESRYAGARLMRSGVASQFDSLGRTPIGHVGDSVTAYLFTYNDQLSRVVHAKITSRQRFQPPLSWRAPRDGAGQPGLVAYL